MKFIICLPICEIFTVNPEKWWKSISNSPKYQTWNTYSNCALHTMYSYCFIRTWNKHKNAKMSSSNFYCFHWSENWKDIFFQGKVFADNSACTGWYRNSRKHLIFSSFTVFQCTVYMVQYLLYITGPIITGSKWWQSFDDVQNFWCWDFLRNWVFVTNSGILIPYFFNPVL